MTPKGHNSLKFNIQRNIDSERYYDVAEIKPSHNEDFNTFTNESPSGEFTNFIK